MFPLYYMKALIPSVEHFSILLGVFWGIKGKDIIYYSILGYGEPGRMAASEVVYEGQRWHAEKGEVRGTIVMISNICQTSGVCQELS